ncbi:iron-containing alcohol dehydrogenase [Zobellella maritima]|uniref:iron-containing alcohol dehydrogenase n=1 Tax=Zobellella maritima TaxID=2059725 RepID=UPI000E3076B0|nr:iron-containing alcohol dehydrogenase [Zobellella maritima]
MTTYVANWNYPTQVKVGNGRIRELADACRQLGMTAPLLVTDPGLAALPMVPAIVAVCREQGMKLAVFSAIKGNPTGENVEDGVAAYRAGGHDGVIALGGGSALDAGKAIALMVGQDRPLWDFEDVGDNWSRVKEEGVAPVVAVPTTAGTGSEVGRASVITDQANHIKRIIFHPKMLPALVILDPGLTVGLPGKITAATGMDALSHNLEAFCAPGYHPMAEGIALEGIRLIHTYLPRAVRDGSDLEARCQMLVASSMGATAFQRGLGGMHALAHPIGALYDAHHGLLNAILMPYVLKANEEAITPAIERLSRYLGLEHGGFNGFLDWVLTLRAELGIPSSLGEIGIELDRAEQIGAMAAVDPSAGGNPIPFTAEQYEQLCRNAITGTL